MALTPEAQDRLVTALETLAQAIVELADNIGRSKIEDQAEQQRQALIQRAESNRDNAASLYSDDLHFVPLSGGREGEGTWLTRDGNNPVVFTPYGWLKASDAPGA